MIDRFIGLLNLKNLLNLDLKNFPVAVGKSSEEPDIERIERLASAPLTGLPALGAAGTSTASGFTVGVENEVVSRGRRRVQFSKYPDDQLKKELVTLSDHTQEEPGIERIATAPLTGLPASDAAGTPTASGSTVGVENEVVSPDDQLKKELVTLSDHTQEDLVARSDRLVKQILELPANATPYGSAAVAHFVESKMNGAGPNKIASGFRALTDHLGEGAKTTGQLGAGWIVKPKSAKVDGSVEAIFAAQWINVEALSALLRNLNPLARVTDSDSGRDIGLDLVSVFKDIAGANSPPPMQSLSDTARAPIRQYMIATVSALHDTALAVAKQREEYIKTHSDSTIISKHKELESALESLACRAFLAAVERSVKETSHAKSRDFMERTGQPYPGDGEKITGVAGLKMSESSYWGAKGTAEFGVPKVPLAVDASLSLGYSATEDTEVAGDGDLGGKIVKGFGGGLDGSLRLASLGVLTKAVDPLPAVTIIANAKISLARLTGSQFKGDTLEKAFTSRSTQGFIRQGSGEMISNDTSILNKYLAPGWQPGQRVVKLLKNARNWVASGQRPHDFVDTIPVSSNELDYLRASRHTASMIIERVTKKYNLNTNIDGFMPKLPSFISTDGLDEKEIKGYLLSHIKRNETDKPLGSALGALDEKGSIPPDFLKRFSVVGSLGVTMDLLSEGVLNNQLKAIKKAHPKIAKEISSSFNQPATFAGYTDRFLGKSASDYIKIGWEFRFNGKIEMGTESKNTTRDKGNYSAAQCSPAVNSDKFRQISEFAAKLLGGRNHPLFHLSNQLISKLDLQFDDSGLDTASLSFNLQENLLNRLYGPSSKALNINVGHVESAPSIIGAKPHKSLLAMAKVLVDLDSDLKRIKQATKYAEVLRDEMKGYGANFLELQSFLSRAMDVMNAQDAGIHNDTELLVIVENFNARFFANNYGINVDNLNQNAIKDMVGYAYSALRSAIWNAETTYSWLKMCVVNFDQKTVDGPTLSNYKDQCDGFETMTEIVDDAASRAIFSDYDQFKYETLLAIAEQKKVWTKQSVQFAHGASVSSRLLQITPFKTDNGLALNTYVTHVPRDGASNPLQAGTMVEVGFMQPKSGLLAIPGSAALMLDKKKLGENSWLNLFKQIAFFPSTYANGCVYTYEAVDTEGAQKELDLSDPSTQRLVLNTTDEAGFRINLHEILKFAGVTMPSKLMGDATDTELLKIAEQSLEELTKYYLYFSRVGFEYNYSKVVQLPIREISLNPTKSHAANFHSQLRSLLTTNEGDRGVNGKTSSPKSARDIEEVYSRGNLSTKKTIEYHLDGPGLARFVDQFAGHVRHMDNPDADESKKSTFLDFVMNEKHALVHAYVPNISKLIHKKSDSSSEVAPPLFSVLKKQVLNRASIAPGEVIWPTREQLLGIAEELVKYDLAEKRVKFWCSTEEIGGVSPYQILSLYIRIMEDIRNHNETIKNVMGYNVATSPGVVNCPVSKFYKEGNSANMNVPLGQSAGKNAYERTKEDEGLEHSTRLNSQAKEGSSSTIGLSTRALGREYMRNIPREFSPERNSLNKMHTLKERTDNKMHTVIEMTDDNVHTVIEMTDPPGSNVLEQTRL